VNTPVAGGHRRIDRVLDPAFLADLASLSLPDVRDRRDVADQEEVDLSYLRRMLQGRLDIVRAEQARRVEGSGVGPLVETLSQVLSEDSRAQAVGLGRHRTLEPSRAGESRRRVETIVADLGLSDPAGLDDTGLTRAVEVLVAEEVSISARRREVQAVLDALGEEIARRYRDGSANVDSLLAQ
jgi:hypothetical protein